MPPTTGCLRSHASRRPTERHISPSTSFERRSRSRAQNDKPLIWDIWAGFGSTPASSPAPPERRSWSARRSCAAPASGGGRRASREGKKEADFSAPLEPGTTAGRRRDGSSASRQRSSRQDVCRSVLLDGKNLFCHFINLYAASIVAGWAGVGAGVSGGSVPPLFSRLTGVYTERPGIPANRPFPHYWAV